MGDSSPRSARLGIAAIATQALGCLLAFLAAYLGITESQWVYAATLFLLLVLPNLLAYAALRGGKATLRHANPTPREAASARRAIVAGKWVHGVTIAMVCVALLITCFVVPLLPWVGTVSETTFEGVKPHPP